ncbi:MAG: hypothetical protein DPW22_01755 [Alphaproteobacteria bacterium]|nr:hypothetical protein [Alphaproteobacteria bacterium]
MMVRFAWARLPLDAHGAAMAEGFVSGTQRLLSCFGSLMVPDGPDGLERSRRDATRAAGETYP